MTITSNPYDNKLSITIHNENEAKILLNLMRLAEDSTDKASPSYRLILMGEITAIERIKYALETHLDKIEEMRMEKKQS